MQTGGEVLPKGRDLCMSFKDLVDLQGYGFLVWPAIFLMWIVITATIVWSIVRFRRVLRSRCGSENASE